MPPNRQNTICPSAQFPEKKTKFLSFDGGVGAVGVLRQPDRYRYWSKSIACPSEIPRGAGLSYSAASFFNAGHSISHTSFDRIVGFDSSSGIVEVEGGVTLYSLFKFLKSRGLYLRIQPGYGGITIGGCIAANVHGKNQLRDGTFIDQVESLTLFHPSHGMMELSRVNNSEIFELTCGGFGLTGHIIRARLRAASIPSLGVRLTATQFSDPMRGIDQLIKKARESDFSYTWHDMASLGSRFGSGYIFNARFVPEDDSNNSDHIESEPFLNLSSDGRTGIPLSLLNICSVRVLNLFYRFRQSAALSGKTITLQDAIFPIHKVQSYFKLFGSPGYHESQVIIPLDGLADYLNEIKAFSTKNNIAITLASAKAFDGPGALLRFTGAGICLALNFPRSNIALNFLKILDDKCVSLGGIPSIIKDSRLPLAVVEKCYPELGEFRARLRSFDPQRIFNSEISKRLEL